MLNQIAMNSIKEEGLLSKKLFSGNQDKEKDTFGAQMPDKVAAFGGSWNFILLFTGSILDLSQYFCFNKPPI